MRLACFFVAREWAGCKVVGRRNRFVLPRGEGTPLPLVHKVRGNGAETARSEGFWSRWGLKTPHFVPDAANCPSLCAGGLHRFAGGGGFPAQVALVFASEIQNKSGKVYKDGAKDVVVKLQKDVLVDGVYGAKQGMDGNNQEQKTSVWNPAEGSEVASTLYAGGDVTIDLNGHAISNNNAEDSLKATADDKSVVETGVFTTGEEKSFDEGLRTAPAKTGTSVIYAKTLDDAKRQFSDTNTESKSNVLPAGAEVSKAELADGKYYYG